MLLFLIKSMTGIREIPGSRYNEALEIVVNFCHATPETVYMPKDIVKILRLDVTPMGLGTSLKSRHKEIGLLKIYDKYRTYFGYSKVCGSGECFSSWCPEETPSTSCRAGNGNKDLEFF